MLITMVFSLKTYCLISFLLVVIRVIQTFKFNCDFFQVCMSLISSNTDFIILCNFGITVLLMISYFISNSILKISFQSMKEQIVTRFQEFIIHFFLILYFTASNNISIDILVFGFIPIYIYYLYLLLDETIKKYSTTQPNIAVRQHQSIFTLEIVLSYVTLKMMIHFLKSYQNYQSYGYFFMYLLYNCSVLLISIIRTILNHVYFIKLKSNQISFFDNFMKQVVIDSVFLVIRGVLIILICVYLLIKTSLQIIVMTSFAGEIIMLINSFKTKILTKEFINSTLNKYPSPTQEEIDADDICIICRTQMSVSDSKKLPCGHIFHKDCIIQWFSNKGVCPTCKTPIMVTPGNNANQRGNREM